MERILFDYKKRIYFSERTGLQVEIPYLKNFLLSWEEIKVLKDKLSRRNMQIRELKKKVALYSQATLEIMNNLSADPIHPTARIVEKQRLEKLMEADNY